MKIDNDFKDINVEEMFKPNSKFKWYSRSIFLASEDNIFMTPKNEDAPYCIYNTNYKCEHLKFDGCCDDDCIFKR